MSGKQIVPTAEKSVQIAIAWCLAWGDGHESQHSLSILHQMKDALRAGNLASIPQEVQTFVKAAQQLDTLDFPETLDSLKNLTQKHPILWNKNVGLVYGGATKIKQYVFEAAKLPDIRGASALLDRILEDLPKFFSEEDQQYLGLIPELIIYSKGGNILAFCPPAFVDELANAIETHYTQETLTANSCAVGSIFRPLEIRFGLLQDPIESTRWLDKFPPDWATNPILSAYFGFPENCDRPLLEKIFENRKNFNELVSKLATQFNLRRSGYDPNTKRPNHLSCRYPPMLETHPYLRRDDSDRSSAVYQITDLPSQPWVSETLARKRWIGQITKQESAEERRWFYDSGLSWDAQAPDSWVTKFKEQFPNNSHYCKSLTSLGLRLDEIQEARSLKEIGDVSNGFVAYIYADGNNMGQHIREAIKTPEQYRKFSDDIFEATEQSVYVSLAEHLAPHYYTPDAQSNRFHKDPVWVHPFEIITIGGDDVLLIVPANKALAIAKTIGDQFEAILTRKGSYAISDSKSQGDRIHRYTPDAPSSNCCLSISSGVLITAVDTPIYYADKLVSQLLKSAKKYAKELKEKHHFHGGTVDFLILKAVTMISSNIEAFRKEGLTIKRPGHQLKLYAVPYTLHELGGLLKTAEALKQSKFPKSQLYQIRSLLERGRRTAILNYRYFRVRLSKDHQKILKDNLEDCWCKADTNNGNLAPWLTAKKERDKTIYETFWRELVELEPFTDAPSDTDTETSSQRVEPEEAKR